MVSGKLIKPILITAAVAGALAPFFSQADLIRRPGSGIRTDSFNTTVVLVDDSSFNDVGWDGTGAMSSYSYNSHHELVYATPADECFYNTFFLPHDPTEYRTDCDYVFDITDRLQLFGYEEIYLDGVVDYSLTWTISKGSKTWQFDADYTAGSTPTLDIAMPSDMKAGNYLVSLSFDQHAPSGKSFFAYSNILDHEICPELYDPPVPVCAIPGSGASFHSINARSQNLFIRAPEPGTWILMLLGGLMLLGRRKSK